MKKILFLAIGLIPFMIFGQSRGNLFNVPDSVTAYRYSLPAHTLVLDIENGMLWNLDSSKTPSGTLENSGKVLVGGGSAYVDSLFHIYSTPSYTNIMGLYSGWGYAPYMNSASKLIPSRFTNFTQDTSGVNMYATESGANSSISVRTDSIEILSNKLISRLAWGSGQLIQEFGKTGGLLGSAGHKTVFINGRGDILGSGFMINPGVGDTAVASVWANSGLTHYYSTSVSNQGIGIHGDSLSFTLSGSFLGINVGKSVTSDFTFRPKALSISIDGGKIVETRVKDMPNNYSYTFTIAHSDTSKNEFKSDSTQHYMGYRYCPHYGDYLSAFRIEPARTFMKFSPDYRRRGFGYIGIDTTSAYMYYGNNVITNIPYSELRLDSFNLNINKPLKINEYSYPSHGGTPGKVLTMGINDSLIFATVPSVDTSIMWLRTAGVITQATATDILNISNQAVLDSIDGGWFNFQHNQGNKNMTLNNSTYLYLGTSSAFTGTSGLIRVDTGEVHFEAVNGITASASSVTIYDNKIVVLSPKLTITTDSIIRLQNSVEVTGNIGTSSHCVDTTYSEYFKSCSDMNILSNIKVKNSSTAPVTPTTVTDVDGNTYNTVVIGTQVWMQSNLKTSHYNNGTAIPEKLSSSDWDTLVTGARCFYNGDSTTYKPIYGTLYNWYVGDSANAYNVCPTGWHVPTIDEFTTLSTYLGGDLTAGGTLKDTGTFMWYSPNTGATNSSHYSAKPSGQRDATGAYTNDHQTAQWWACTSTGLNNPDYRYVQYNNTTFPGTVYNKRAGMAIRCLYNQVNTVDSSTYITPTKVSADSIITTYLSVGNFKIRTDSVAPSAAVSGTYLYMEHTASSTLWFCMKSGVGTYVWAAIKNEP